MHPVEFVMRKTIGSYTRSTLQSPAPCQSPRNGGCYYYSHPGRSCPNKGRAKILRSLQGMRRGSNRPSEPVPSAPSLVFVWLPCVLCPEASPVLQGAWLLAQRSPSPQTHFQHLLRVGAQLVPPRGCCLSLCQIGHFLGLILLLTLAANPPTGSQTKSGSESG